MFLLAVLALASTPGTVWGQTQAEYRARVQALVPVWRKMAALKHREDSIVAHDLPRDTLCDGSLVVLTDSALMPFARQVVRQAAAKLERRFGAASNVLRGHLYLLSIPAWDSTENVVDLAEVDRAGQSHFLQGEPRSVTAVTGAIVQHAAETLWGELGPGFGRWLGGGFSADSATAAMWTGVRIDLVTSSFAASRACYAGADTACALALGVAGESDPGVRWFSAAERQDRIRRMTLQLDSDNPQQYEQCVKFNTDAACTALIHLLPPDDLFPPLGTFARQSLVTLALDVGGPDAFVRMRAAPDTRQAQLAAAAGMPVDSLVGLWRRRALQARTSNPSMNWGMALASLMWVATCGALSLRSSPWR